jgi:hypothetical protein
MWWVQSWSHETRGCASVPVLPFILTSSLYAGVPGLQGIDSGPRAHLGEAANPWVGVTPTFYKNKFFCANRSAYQIVVHMKNFPKINLV